MKRFQARPALISVSLLMATLLAPGQAAAAIDPLAVLGTLLTGGATAAATDPGLGTAGSFGVLGGTTVINTGPTTIDGNLGVSPGTAIVGFAPTGPGSVNPPGTTHANDAVAAQAQSDLTAAYNAAAGSSCTQILTGTDLGGLTLVPGTYCFDTSAQLTGSLTLNSQGNPNSVFIFKIGSTLTTASGSSVGFINGPSCSVYWQVGSSATLGTTTAFTGSILAQASITANTGATVEGRLLARDGAVTLDSNTVTSPACAAAPTPVPDPTPAPTPVPDPTPTPIPDAGTPLPSTTSPISTVIGPDSSLPPGGELNPADIVFVSPPGSTGTTITPPTSSDNPSQPGQPITLTTEVTSINGGVPTGTVTFIDGSTILGSSPVDKNGVATVTTSRLTTGDHPITAVYQGSDRLTGSISRLFLQTVASSSTATGKELPTTGIDALRMGLAGTTAILLGMALMSEGRRRGRKAMPVNAG